MKNLRDILIVVAVGTALFFPTDADAGPFKKRKAKRAAKQATVQYTSPDCTITGCPTHSQPGAGQLGVNKDGGFTGQLTDSYYANYFAAQAPTPAEVPDVPAEAPAEISIMVAPAGSVEDAQAALANAEAILAEARATVEQALHEQQQADAREALELQQQIDDLTAQLAALEPEE